MLSEIKREMLCILPKITNIYIFKYIYTIIYIYIYMNNESISVIFPKKFYA